MSGNLLILGNKRYSSWSLRGYLACQFAGLSFEEVVIPLFQPETPSLMAKYIPTGPARVPVLIVDGHEIWDTMAIMEYAAENSRQGSLWPGDGFDRAWARSIVAEMHSGFVVLRSYIPMNLDRLEATAPLPKDVQADVLRIEKIWTDCRQAFSSKGPYLFGKLSMADAAFAPVAVRLKSRSIAMPKICDEYIEAIYALPAFKQWQRDAAKEEWVISQ
jgi:glutathione S-transferase